MKKDARKLFNITMFITTLSVLIVSFLFGIKFAIPTAAFVFLLCLTIIAVFYDR